MKILCAKLDITKLNLELNLDFIAKYPEAIVNFMLYENTMRSIRHYQAKLGLEFEENCNINAAYIYIWKYMSVGGAKHIICILLKTMIFVRNT